ncbi:seryl-tRNA synthetase [Xylariaceae sp. FL0804]|nr:seryl-tRNA synthetase [Xylariaceae sp. FL0804]
MKAARARLAFIYPQPRARQLFHSSAARAGDGSTERPRPVYAPKINIDIRHIRENPELHAQNALERNYKAHVAYPARINTLASQMSKNNQSLQALGTRSNILQAQMAGPDLDSPQREGLRREARDLKPQIAALEAENRRMQDEMTPLALAMPNLTSSSTPRGDEPRLLSTFNNPPAPPAEEDAAAGGGERWPHHADIGVELGLLDLAGAATTSGRGWYFLDGEGARLERALVAYALDVVLRRPGWAETAVPSIVHGHVAAACGFQPRDQHDEQQTYGLQTDADDDGGGGLCLAATAEIPLAGKHANTKFEPGEMPHRRVAASRCYRREAGAAGAATRGLYRVHEFTKVEMFAWTAPLEAMAAHVFDDVVAAQTEILRGLGLPCRVLEMPAADLGASAARKVDIEAYFPGRGRWGELTSASLCTDYQTRRLNTRLRYAPGTTGGHRTTRRGRDAQFVYPWTVNGTALAVPRVIAALLENGWDPVDRSVAIPACLRPWMGGKDRIRKQS